MGLLTNRVEREEIKAGDHIYTWRVVFSYAHHGIYVGNNKVVHFTREPERDQKRSSSLSSSMQSFRPPSTCPVFPDCGFRRPRSGVVLTCLDCFLGGGSLHYFEYGVTPSVFLAKVRGGTCTLATSDPPETVTHRAMYLLRNGLGNYDVFDNNCEDFALYCKTSLLTCGDTRMGRSGQASSIMSASMAALFSSPFKMFMAGPIGVATMTAGVRTDVDKVEVEDMAVEFGWDEDVADQEGVSNTVAQLTWLSARLRDGPPHGKARITFSNALMVEEGNPPQKVLDFSLLGSRLDKITNIERMLLGALPDSLVMGAKIIRSSANRR
ncbi:hypothetical protein QJS04_geneDACA007009 [Acorus gramineus]|uniref:LRAT domain-containing protein n=1 Tax=Acorus gramineus TaxID=55184 RepID=A0AAV9A2K5_ACOGR|nr:hypothetical protein QJS04_geneDACA007009 [Acorus gramineus]